MRDAASSAEKARQAMANASLRSAMAADLHIASKIKEAVLEEEAAAAARERETQAKELAETKSQLTEANAKYAELEKQFADLKAQVRGDSSLDSGLGGENSSSAAGNGGDKVNFAEALAPTNVGANPKSFEIPPMECS